MDDYTPPPELLEHLQTISSDAADYSGFVCYGVFSILIGLDVWRAYCKRAIWLPGKAFALTGVTVQIIAWFTSSSNINGEDVNDVDNLIFIHQLVVTGRVAVCVFIGYLLPGMSAPSARTFATLAITICIQIASEMVILFKEKSTSYLKSWSTIANLFLFTCIIVLGLILGCTILASKTIHGLLSQRISAISSIIEEDDFQFSNERIVSISWNDFEDKVLRSWFVAHVCQVDYVICRSDLSSAVGMVVTISVIICLLSNTYGNQFFSHYIPVRGAAMLFSFIVVGWVAICWRWLSAQLYFRMYRNSWRKRLCLEDFWKSNIVDLIHTYDLKRDRLRFQRSNSKMRRLSKLQSLPANIFTKIRLHKLLYLMLMLQVTVVFFAKLCGLLSEVIVGRFVYWCRKHMRKTDSIESPEKYARTLECVCMPGEDPFDLWEANQMSFNNVKLLMKKSHEKGSSCDEIHSIFRTYSLQWIEDGAQLLNMLKERALPLVMKHFPTVEKQCVKMTVVSLITIFIGLHKAKSVRLTKVVKACGEVWDLLAFVDDCDIDLHANEIVLLDDLNRDKDQVCMAADREFYKLQKEYEKHSFGCDEVHIFLQDQLQKYEGLLRRENLLGDCKEMIATDLSDSKDWMKIEPSYTLYKLCKLMLDEDIEDLETWTEKSLRNVIAFSMSRLPDMLVKQCWKWAKEFEEDKMWEAFHLAGKCRGVMEAWGLEPHRH